MSQNININFGGFTLFLYSFPKLIIKMKFIKFFAFLYIIFSFLTRLRSFSNFFDLCQNCSEITADLTNHSYIAIYMAFHIFPKLNFFKKNWVWNHDWNFRTIQIKGWAHSKSQEFIKWSVNFFWEYFEFYFFLKKISLSSRNLTFFGNSQSQKLE